MKVITAWSMDKSSDRIYMYINLQLLKKVVNILV